MSAFAQYAFPELNKFDEVGAPLVTYINLNGLGARPMRVLCKKYGIRYSNLRAADMRKRLVAFSTDRTQWNLQVLVTPGNIQRHVGPRAGSKRAKLSTQRWNAKKPDQTSDSHAKTSSRLNMDPMDWASMILKAASSVGSSTPTGPISTRFRSAPLNQAGIIFLGDLPNLIIDVRLQRPTAIPANGDPFPAGTILLSISQKSEGRLAVYFIPKSVDSDSRLLPLQVPGGTVRTESPVPSGHTLSDETPQPPASVAISKLYSTTPTTSMRSMVLPFRQAPIQGPTPPPRVNIISVDLQQIPASSPSSPLPTELVSLHHTPTLGPPPPPNIIQFLDSDPPLPGDSNESDVVFRSPEPQPWRQNLHQKPTEALGLSASGVTLRRSPTSPLSAELVPLHHAPILGPTAPPNMIQVDLGRIPSPDSDPRPPIYFEPPINNKSNFDLSSSLMSILAPRRGSLILEPTSRANLDLRDDHRPAGYSVKLPATSRGLSSHSRVDIPHNTASVPVFSSSPHFKENSPPSRTRQSVVLAPPKQSDPESEKLIRVALAKETVWVRASDVPDPPVFDKEFRGCMKEVIHHVLKWWDDKRPEWDPTAARLNVNVDGRKVAIPATRWKDLYLNKWRKKQWGGLKDRISNLKLFFEAYDEAARVGLLDNFWMGLMEQSPGKGGEQIACYTKAMATLREQRKVNNGVVADRIQATEQFSYTKEGQVVVLTDPAAIVRRACQRPG
ncbi:hypothetical protein C8J57DRAFT_1507860 [Mycena rebaudengoi]|nr:hypothetical protein C8J57DRAFT_1507860 [Mycena rebaudengoi]